ncbi:helix-turn-helix domain-containing protein [Luteibacter aegosomatissinici]|uniref:helix-turn-helix domain-containing protein n=1 Tax=Luteibacter aegosomatissinici TaxID=2911539 RepID=UPI001FFABD04|nr:AraC family transcriptional regulator [Luteibacter aegosomatissinici]UPG92782.1 AraC family transcriptional regulator [Luteibacter aegosomatissinici]
MQKAVFTETVCRRFNASSLKTIFARSEASDPIAISRVITQATRTKKLPAEPAFVVHVQTGQVNHGELYVDDLPLGLRTQHAGHVRIVDMAGRPYADIHDDADFLRINLSYRTLDELAYEHGLPRSLRLQQTVNVMDPVLHGLASALLAHFDLYGEHDQLFIDYVGLAFFVHIARRYGDTRLRERLPGQLTPGQLKSACDMLLANMSGGVNLSELARACEISPSYFARCFRRTTGVPPHRWLMNERVRLAKRLLREGPMPISEIAYACGFSDQSHLTRIFIRSEAVSPGRWRKQFRPASESG